MCTSSVVEYPRHFFSLAAWRRDQCFVNRTLTALAGILQAAPKKYMYLLGFTNRMLGLASMPVSTAPSRPDTACKVTAAWSYPGFCHEGRHYPRSRLSTVDTCRMLLPVLDSLRLNSLLEVSPDIRTNSNIKKGTCSAS